MSPVLYFLVYYYTMICFPGNGGRIHTQCEAKYSGLCSSGSCRTKTSWAYYASTGKLGNILLVAIMLLLIMMY